MSNNTLKGLNTYRGVAALVVLVSHVELFKQKYALPNLFSTVFFKYTGGHIAVILFFALSGFLITLLLLRERDKYQTVSLPKFYLRRIFRVWPLYYLVIGLSLLFFGYSPSAGTLLLCLTIFPNIAHALHIGWALSPQIWSIGVEEQFYLLWAPVAKKTDRLIFVLLSVFLFFTFAPHFIQFFLNRQDAGPASLALVEELGSVLKFNCMAAGGLVAVAYHRKYRIVNFFRFNAFISYGFVLLPFVLWFSGFHLPFFTDEIYAVLFAVSVLNVSTSPHVINIDVPFTFFLGKISYGIYMYHWLLLEIFFRNALGVLPAGSPQFNILLYFVAVTGTIGVSTLSYEYLEKPLLAIKDKRYGR